MRDQIANVNSVFHLRFFIGRTDDYQAISNSSQLYTGLPSTLLAKRPR